MIQSHVLSKRVPKLKLGSFLGMENSPNLNPPPVQPPITPWNLFLPNLLVALMHLVQCIVVLALTISATPSDSVPFLAGMQYLRFTNQAIIQTGSPPNECMEDSSSAPVLIANYTNKPSPLDPKFYDFNNTLIYQYYEATMGISTPNMVCVFFLLSFVFQLVNGFVLRHNADQPRLLHYVEYAITGSLCLIIMAVNFGVREASAITGLFGLFFGMNMLGACSELLMYATEKYKEGGGGNVIRFLFNEETNLWCTAHGAGWVLFAFAIGPVIAQYRNFHECSERTPPGYIVATIAVEVLIFFAFGAVQLWGLIMRTRALSRPDGERYAILWYTDVWMIGLSLLAKSLLAWLLLAPSIALGSKEFVRRDIFIPAV